MIRRLLHIALLGAALIPAVGTEAKGRNVLDVKTEITDSNIIYPESFETDTKKMLEGWYMKNYTATDDRYRRQGDVAVSDETLKDLQEAWLSMLFMLYNANDCRKT